MSALLATLGLGAADWLWVALSVVLAYTVFGFGGFGAGVVGLPLIVHVLPLRTAVPTTLLLDLTFSLWLGLKARQLVERGELLRLAPWAVGGMAVGVLALTRVPEAWLVAVLGSFVTLYALHSLFGRAATAPVSPRWAVPTGLVGGVFTALFGTGAPVYTLYLARRIADTARLRASIGTLVFVAAVLRLALFSAGGLYTSVRLPLLALTLLPGAGLGFWLGSRLHARLPERQVRRLIWVLLVASGLSLLARASTGH